MTRQYGVATDDELARAVDALRAGELVAFPTETVYGLGADAANAVAVRRLYDVKRRPADHPVIVHVARAAQLDVVGRDVPAVAHALADACWPGPLTIVVVRDDRRVVAEATGGRPTVGVRVPDHPVALALLDAFGGGVAAPSANRFGRVSPTTAAHVRADLGGDVAVVLDGGPCRVGVESTIVDVTAPSPVILRLGGIGRAQLEEVTGGALPLRTAGEVAAPGTLASHYAPRAAVRIVDATAIATAARALVDRGTRVGLLAPRPLLDRERRATLPGELVVLDAPADDTQYARQLYARLREADERELDVLLVVVPDDADGLGAAVADRLRRAAADESR